MDQVKFFKGYLQDHVSRVISTSSECPINFGIFQRTICELKETLKLK